MKTDKGKYNRRQIRDDEAEEHFVITGKNPVLEAFRSGQQIDKLLVLKDNRDHVIGDLIDKAKQKKIIVQSVEKSKLEALSEGQPHQGVAALLAPFPYQTIDDVLAFAEKKNEDPLVVICDHITDPHNLGAIIRSANLCGAHGVIFPKRRSAALTPSAVKASSGAVAYIPIVKTGNLGQCIEELKQKGFWIMAADMDGQPYEECRMDGALAVIIGSEGKGVSPTLKKLCDFTTAIPIYGEIDSFNASAAAAIILSEAARQRHRG